MSSKQFTARVFRWLDQVNADRDLPASALKVAVRLSSAFNEAEGGMAWPSCKTIADDIGMSKGSVVDLAHRLQARGHLRVEWGERGRGRSNQYWMILKPRPAEVLEPAKGQRTDLLEPEKRSVSARRKGQSGDGKGQSGEKKGQPADLTLSKTHRRFIEGESDSRPGDASLGKKRKSRASEGITPEAEQASEAERTSQFEIFWRAYPRHVAKGAARKAFAKALERAEAEALIAGARRYAAEREGEPPRYTAYPATWLNGDRWQDEAGEGGPPIIDGITGDAIESPRRHNGHRREETWEDIARQVVEDMEARHG